jgi:hypothetical protein
MEVTNSHSPSALRNSGSEGVQLAKYLGTMLIKERWRSVTAAWDLLNRKAQLWGTDLVIRK